VFDQWYADRGGDAQGLERRGFLRGQFEPVIADHQRLTGSQALDRGLPEGLQAVVADDAGRAGSRPVVTDGEAVFIGVHMA